MVKKVLLGDIFPDMATQRRSDANVGSLVTFMLRDAQRCSEMLREFQKSAEMWEIM